MKGTSCSLQLFQQGLLREKKLQGFILWKFFSFTKICARGAMRRWTKSVARSRRGSLALAPSWLAQAPPVLCPQAASLGKQTLGRELAALPCPAQA